MISDFSQLIAKIGKGQKASKDLNWEEAKRAMRLLVENQATPTQVGAFLLAMRVKVESVAELAAFTSAAREYVPALPVPRSLSLVDLPVYAGKQETLHASIGAAILASSAGASVLMHGHDGVPERPGAVAVLAKLGIPTDLTPKQAAEEVTAKGFAYLDIALYHPPIARFLDLRRELGVRSFFHPVAKMLNPARASVQVIGLTHPPYFDKMAEALKMLGGQRALIVRGVEGDPEISIAGSTRVLELRDDRIASLMLAPKDFALSSGVLQDMAGFPPEQAEQEAGLLRRILRNEVQGAQRDWIVLNAAMLLYAVGKGLSISAGLPLAQQALESGAAARKLEELATTTVAAGAGLAAGGASSSGESGKGERP
jgi:anthranilate phosphoribosyltransferase